MTPPSTSTSPPLSSVALASSPPSSTPSIASSPNSLPPPPTSALSVTVTSAPTKHLECIYSSHDDFCARLAASLSLKLSKYAKATRELTAATNIGSPADDFCHVGMHAEISKTSLAFLRERAHEVLDEGFVGVPDAGIKA